MVTGGILALIKAMAPHERVFQGKSAVGWREELSSGDAATSNRAIIILNTSIIPELTDVALQDTNDSGFKLTIVDALNELPGVRVSFLYAPGRRGDALKELGKFGPATEAAIPVLIQILKGNDGPATRGAAAAALGEIHSDPDVAIPALIACLEDSDVNDQAAEALGKFGTLAKAAVPKLRPLLHGDKEARRASTLALPRIDPEAAAKAGIPERTIKSSPMDESERFAAHKAAATAEKAK